MSASRVPVALRSVLCQHHGDRGDVCCGHSHRPSVSPSQPKQWTDAAIGKSRTCEHGTDFSHFQAVWCINLTLDSVLQV